MVKISIITTSLNAENTIFETMESISRTKAACVEHILIDAGSSDGTLDIARRYKNLTIATAPGASIAEAWNIGIKMAHGEIIGILNADDFYMGDVLTTVSDFYSLDHNKLTILIGTVMLCDNNLLFNKVVDPRVPTLLNIYAGLPFLHPGVFVPKVVYDQVGFFDERFRVGMDSNWLLRAFAAGITFDRGDFSVAMRDGGLSSRQRWVGFGEYLMSLSENKRTRSLITPALVNAVAVNVKKSIKGMIGRRT